MKPLGARSLALLGTALLVGALLHAGSGGCGSSGPIVPTVKSIYPAAGSAGIPIETLVTATFDRPMDAGSIDVSSFTLRESSSTNLSGEAAAVEGTVLYDPALQSATFAPSVPLTYGAEYVATINGTVQDVEGNVMGTDCTWTFTSMNARTYLSLVLASEFGDSGVLAIDPGRNVAMAAAVKVQADGKVLISGYDGDSVLGANAKLAVVRFDLNGNLDSGFGTGGIATVDCTSRLGLNWWSKHGLAIQSDGRILVGGECDKVATVFRLNADGSPDATFDGDGKAVLPTDPGQNHSAVFALGLQQDAGQEKVVLGGQLEPASWRAKWLLARLNADGSLDATFAGGAGILFQQWRHYDEGIVDFAVLADGRIIVYGGSISAVAPNMADFAVARYSASGVLDLTFAAGDPAGIPGLAVIRFGEFSSWPFSVKVMEDGRIVGGVHVHSDETGATRDNNFGAFRLTPDGALDAAFASGGKAEIDFGSHAVDIGNAIVLLPDGHMILGGESQGSAVAHPGGWGDWLSDWPENDFSLTMLDADGAINTHFGENGFILTDILGDHDGILAMTTDAVVTDDAGNVQSFELYAVGLAREPVTGDYRYAVAKYRSVLVQVPE